MAKKVLFIGHDATRSGAPIVLLHLLTWIKAQTNLDFILLLAGGGELEAEYKALCPVLRFDYNSVGIPGLGKRALNHLGLQALKRKRHLKSIKSLLPRDEIALIYSNTATNGQVLGFLADRDCPVITHVHELEFVIRNHPGAWPFERVQEYTDHYIAASVAVKENLIQNHSVSKEKIDVVHEFILTELYTLDNQTETRNKICDELEIPRDAFIVGASGTVHWRKGTDLFIQLARAVHQRPHVKPAYFIWVGDGAGGSRVDELQHDIKNTGLTEYVKFLGAKPNPLEYFAAFDIFAMISREDPFPLVNLETASLGKSIICFDNAGGSREFVEDDCGFIVPYLDIEAAAAKTIELMKSPELRERLGRRAAEKVRQRHDVSVAAPKILEIIERLI